MANTRLMPVDRSIERIAALEQELRRYKNMLDHLPLMVWSKDTSGRFVAANQRVAEVAGLHSAAEILGKTDRDIFPPEIAERYLAADRAVQAKQQPIVADEPYPDGWLETGRLPANDEQGRLTGTIGFARDITPQKQYQELLRENAALEHRLGRLAASAPGVMYTLRLTGPQQGYFPYISPAIQDLAELAPSELESDIAPLWRLIHPDDQPLAGQEFEASSRNLTPYRAEFRLMHPSRGERWIEIRATPENDSDGGLLWHGFLIDISDQIEERHAHELTSFALDQVREAAYVIDDELRIAQVNNEACRALGYRREELLGMRVPDIDPDMDQASTMQIRRAFGTQAEEPITFETRHQCKDGRIFPVEILATYFVFRLRRLSLCLVRDISERKRLEGEAQAREQMFRTLAENSPDLIYRYDRDCRRLYVNPAVGRIIGKPVTTLLGNTPEDGNVLLPAQSQKLTTALRAVIASGENWRLDLDLTDRDGRRRDYDVRLVPEIDHAGQVVSVMLIGRDISAIRDTQRQLSDFVANVPGFVYTSRRSADSLTDSMPFASPGISELFGLHPEDVREDITPILALIHPEDRPRIGAAVLASARALTPIRLEVRVQCPDQPERWIEFRSTPLREADGGVLWHGIMLDINERKQEQQQLELLNFAFNQISETILLFNREHRVVRANHAACRNLGYALDELLGQTVFAITPSITPERIDEIDRQLATCEHGLLVEGLHLTKDGRIYPVESSITAFAYDNQPMVLVINRDISERKRLETELARRETEFRTLIENTPDTIARYDLDGRRLYGNPALLEASRVGLGELLGKTPAECSPFPPPEGEAYTEVVRQVMVSGRAAETEIHWEKDGLPVCMQLRITPEFDNAGRVVSALGVGRDVSALKQSEARLRKSHDVLRAMALHRQGERETERRNLAHQIHEDLAQNLTVLRMNLSLLQMQDEAAPFFATFATMRDITERCIVRIRDMVTMLRPAVLELGITPALRWLAKDFTEGIGFEFALDLTKDLRLDQTIATAIFRAAHEMLINVALHAAANRVEISLTVSDGFCHLRITDNGRGFDPSAPRADHAFGLLGLSEQAAHLGGELSIRSAPAQGTCIELRLPATPPPADLLPE